MADKTIKAYVERRLREGGVATLEQIWRDVRANFPHRAPGWNYVMKIKRDLEQGDDDAKADPAGR